LPSEKRLQKMPWYFSSYPTYQEMMNTPQSHTSAMIGNHNFCPEELPPDICRVKIFADMIAFWVGNI